MTPMSFTVEQEHGTFTGARHGHNGYYAGDFTNTRMRTPSELAALTRLGSRTFAPRRPTPFPEGPR
jgi:hypothetical protein